MNNAKTKHYLKRNAYFKEVRVFFISHIKKRNFFLLIEDYQKYIVNDWNEIFLPRPIDD